MEGGKVDIKDYYSFDIVEFGLVEIKFDGLNDKVDLKLYDEIGEVEFYCFISFGNIFEEIFIFISFDIYVVGVFGLGN